MGGAGPSSDRFEYTVIGAPVNEAARITDAAKQRPRRLLAAGATVEHAVPEERSRWRPAGDLALRGIDTPVTVQEPSE